MKRYNFQCSELVGIKLAKYITPWYQEIPPLDLNPATIDSIQKIDQNTISIFSNNESLKFSTQPYIRIDDSEDYYIRLDDSITEFNFNIETTFYYYPQDFTEAYLRELTTRLINMKNRTNYKTSDFFKL
jgi:hypothetical protein